MGCPQSATDIAGVKPVLYNTGRGAFSLLHWVGFPELCPETVSSEPKARGGKSWGQSRTTLGSRGAHYPRAS